MMGSVRSTWFTLATIAVATTVTMACREVGGPEERPDQVQPNPAPLLSEVAPSCVAAGSAGTVLMVTGENFITRSVVRWDGVDRTTTYVSDAKLKVQIGPTDLVLPGSSQVTVYNPGPGGGSSAGKHVEVAAIGGFSLYWPVCPDIRLQLGQAYAESELVTVDHHAGLDITAGLGTPVLAAGEGHVVLIQENDEGCNSNVAGGCADHGFGNTVIVKHELPSGVLYSQYSHLSSIDERVREACGPLEDKTVECEPPVHVSSGTYLGQVGRTAFGQSNETPHLHFELKTAQGGAGLGTSCDNTTRYGYTTVHPDECGYRDPILELHDVSPVLTALTVAVTESGAGKYLHVGPSARYRYLMDAGDPGNARELVSGEEFSIAAVALATPQCSAGWYQVRNPGEVSFADPYAGGVGQLPHAWVCAGDGGEAWLGSTTIFASSGSASLMGSYPPSNLYVVEPDANGEDILVGRVRTSLGQNPVITDLAMSPEGSLFGISFNALYIIDTGTAIAEELGSLGLYGANALAFDHDGRLYGATQSGSFLEINTTTGHADVIGYYSSGLESWGDLAFGPDGTLYGAVRTAAGTGLLVTVDRTSGQTTPVDPANSLGFDNVWGLVFVGNKLYGLTSTYGTGIGQLIEIDTNTGVGTRVRDLTFDAFGAAGTETVRGK